MLVPLKEAKRSARWRALRKSRAPDLMQRLIKAFGRRCQYCALYGDETGVPVADDPRLPGRRGHIFLWSVDRIDPTGTYDPSNVTLACNSCNGRKGRRLPDFPVVSLAMLEADNGLQ
jgi:5-methylcytosine-specific restriction endonuclease McrA